MDEITAISDKVLQTTLTLLVWIFSKGKVRGVYYLPK